MLTPYRRVLSLPGALVFCVSGLFGRLPLSMAGLGIVVLVSSRTGSYATAGSVSASYVIGQAALAIPQARLVDRLGQRRVLPAAVTLFAGALVAMMASVELGAPSPWPHLCAAAAGAGMPQIGSSVRARWSLVVRDRRDLQTAFAVEAVVDESVFMIGPTLVTLLATAVHPLAGLGTAVVATAAGTAGLVSQRSTEPPPRPRRQHGHGAMPWRMLAPLTVSNVALGMLFGGAEVATVAFCDEAGHKPLAGVLLAVWALGSLLSGVVVGALPMQSPSATRFRWFLLGLAVLMTPLALVHSTWLLGGLLFLAGFAVSPALIAGVGWVEEQVPAGRITEGIAMVNTGLSAGVAPGAAIAGVVIDAHGASSSYWFTAAAGAFGAAVAFATAAVTHSFSWQRPSPSGSSR
jgi:MFS family permease